MLQKFRTIDLVWDLANKNFHQAIELSSSDEQGRRIIVQVLDNGQVVDLTGVGLNLYWETKDKHYMGLDNFTALDVRKGLFELYATTELLSNVGALKGHLYLVTAEGEAITSLSLGINVNRGINTEAVESQNSFSALTEALVRVVEIEAQEQERKDDENTRQDAEDLRQTNEVKRVGAEAQRVNRFSDKLVEWDNSYDTAESQRNDWYNTSETKRDNDYQTAEQDRYTLYQSAEQERESNFESRAGQLEEEYAPRLNEVTAHMADYATHEHDGNDTPFIKWTNVSGKPDLLSRMHTQYISAGATHNFGRFDVDDGVYLVSGSRSSVGSVLWVVLTGTESVFKIHGDGQQGVATFDDSNFTYKANVGGGETVKIIEL